MEAIPGTEALPGPARPSAPLPAPLERFRSYLGVLARVGLHPLVRRRLDPSDVVQETLLEAHRDRAAFRGGTVGEQARWLERMLAHNLQNVVRDLGRQRRDPGREQPLGGALESSARRLESWIAAQGARPSELVQRQERVLALARAVEGLPEDQMEAVVLRYWRGFSLVEIAAAMERTPASVAGLLHRGLERLRQHLTPEDGP